MNDNTVWLASHLPHLVTKQEWDHTNVETVADSIINPSTGHPISLRLASQLELGVARLYLKQNEDLLEHCLSLCAPEERQQHSSRNLDHSSPRTWITAAPRSWITAAPRTWITAAPGPGSQQPPDLDHSSPPNLDHGSPPNMDHGSPPNMDHGSPPNMDHGSPPNMDHGSPSNLDHGSPNSPPLEQPPIAVVPVVRRRRRRRRRRIIDRGTSFQTIPSLAGVLRRAKRPLPCSRLGVWQRETNITMKRVFDEPVRPIFGALSNLLKERPEINGAEMGPNMATDTGSLEESTSAHPGVYDDESIGARNDNVDIGPNMTTDTISMEESTSAHLGVFLNNGACNDNVDTRPHMATDTISMEESASGHPLNDDGIAIDRNDTLSDDPNNDGVRYDNAEIASSIPNMATDPIRMEGEGSSPSHVDGNIGGVPLRRSKRNRVFVEREIPAAVEEEENNGARNDHVDTRPHRATNTITMEESASGHPLNDDGSRPPPVDGNNIEESASGHPLNDDGSSPPTVSSLRHMAQQRSSRGVPRRQPMVRRKRRTYTIDHPNSFNIGVDVLRRSKRNRVYDEPVLSEFPRPPPPARHIQSNSGSSLLESDSMSYHGFLVDCLESVDSRSVQGVCGSLSGVQGVCGSLSGLLEHKSIEYRARYFYELMGMKTAGYIEVIQEEPYGDIFIVK